jgi:RNA polymerase sigma factor (sigma-70 family)
MSRSSGPGAQTVLAAQEGDEEALENLLSEYLPLIYNIVGRGLNGHADVDDVVQETMLRVVRSVRDLRDPEAFRSWLVAVAIRQMHDHRQQRQAAPLYGLRPDVADPGADFVDLTLLRLGLSGQRRETAQATRWLDGSDHDLLALWWLEAGGELERGEIAAALGLTPSHAAVRIARMKEQLAVARVVVRALQAVPLCAGLADVTADWDQAPSPLWRKRIARHTRDCPHCAGHYQGLIPAERLLAGLPLITAAGAAGGNWLSGNWLSGNWLTRGSHAQSPRTQAPGRQAPSPAGQAHPGGRPPGPRPGRPPGPRAGARHGPRPGQRAIRRIAARARHGRVLAKTAGSLQPKLLAVALAVSCVAAGTVALVHQHKTRPAALPGSPAASPAVTPGPVTAVIAQPTPSPSPSHPQPAVIASATAAADAKKGVGAWTFSSVSQALAESGASWYYTWSASHAGITSPPGVQFVPMIWGAGSVTAATLSQAKAAGQILLGFNEPDMSGQANMAVSQALSLWPRLMATGMSLGSPAVADNAATPGGWLDQFMQGAAARGYRVNFITVHWYGADFTTGPAVQQLESYLQAIYNRYHLPIWLTEFALANFGGGSPSFPTESQQAAFLTAATTMLEHLSYVQRYAWFGLGSSATDGSMGLFGSGPVATTVGRAFEAVDAAR